jgi:hypothetical protein
MKIDQFMELWYYYAVSWDYTSVIRYNNLFSQLYTGFSYISTYIQNFVKNTVHLYKYLVILQISSRTAVCMIMLFNYNSDNIVRACGIICIVILLLA